jgi:hypothetical protein
MEMCSWSWQHTSDSLAMGLGSSVSGTFYVPWRTR